MLVFLACAVFGGVLLLLQLVSGLAAGDADGAGAHHLDLASPGAHAEAPTHDHVHAAAGLNLLSVRALSAAVAFFGLAGAMATARGVGLAAAAAVGLAIGLLAALGVATLSRLLLRFESDGAVRLQNAVGTTGTVYIPVPAARGGAGKVQLALQGRVVEVAAVTVDDHPLATGAPVLVIDVDGETLVVAADPVASRAP